MFSKRNLCRQPPLDSRSTQKHDEDHHRRSGAPEGIYLTHEYLHIHFLSHYNCHTDREYGSLDWLESAIEKFFAKLRAPRGIWVENGLVTVNYEPQRLHHLRHYVSCIHAMGAMEGYSTQKMEIPQTSQICLRTKQQ